MSYGSELATEIMINRETEYQYQVGLVMRGLWTTKYGKHISILDMTNEHIENCIKMLSKKAEYGSELAELWIERFKQELVLREKGRR